jgi:hypothetical protein
MPSLQRIVRVIAVVFACVGATAFSSSGQDRTPTQTVEIPAGATALEGVPTVRIDAAETGATRRVLDAAEAASQRLKVKVLDGKLYWASRGNRLLQLDTSGEFTYLASEPGQYIRLRAINDRIEYVEHVDQAAKSVTWWGELRIIIGN